MIFKLGFENCMGVHIDMTDLLIEQEVMFDNVSLLGTMGFEGVWVRGMWDDVNRAVHARSNKS